MPWGGVNPANAAGCGANKYVSTCKFVFDVNGAPFSFQDATDINPRNIFAFVAWLSSNTNPTDPNHKGYLCWDFAEPKNNYDNLRKLFNPQPTDGEINCYLISRASIFDFLSMIDNNVAPLATKWSIGKTTYEPFGEMLKNACDKNSINTLLEGADGHDWCVPCPNGKSAGATYDDSTNKWTVFSTIADCYSGTDEHHTIKDNRGEFYYVNPGKCYYSGG